jgi:2',3'-cyclic-nucleotide 2'-phosphodiesterase (5'-nucleotidase family)
MDKKLTSNILAVSIIVISVILFFGTSANTRTEIPLTLIYSSNTLGEVIPCGCIEAGNAGGISRRSHYINTVRDQGKKVLLLDGGNALAIGQPGNETERGKARKRAEFILNLYGKMGYDAVNIGDTDLVLGLEYLRTLQKHSPVPFLSANLKEKKTRKTVFKPYLVKEIQGLKVGIIGLMTQSIPPMLNKIRGYFVEDPAKVATDTINGALLDCDIIIALAHMNHSEIESFAQKVPKISIIIGGHNRSYMDAKMVNRSLWVQSDAFGFQIGRLDVRWVKGSSDFQYKNVLTVLHPEMKADPQIEEMITSSSDILKRPLP